MVIHALPSSAPMSDPIGNDVRQMLNKVTPQGDVDNLKTAADGQRRYPLGQGLPPEIEFEGVALGIDVVDRAMRRLTVAARIDIAPAGQDHSIHAGEDRAGRVIPRRHNHDSPPSPPDRRHILDGEGVLFRIAAATVADDADHWPPVEHRLPHVRSKCRSRSQHVTTSLNFRTSVRAACR